MDGIVRWFSYRLGYGFIISPGVADLTHPDGKPRDVFVHHSKIQMEGFRKLDPDERVSYDLVWTAEGQPQAERVVRQAASE